MGNNSSLVQATAWHKTDRKPFPEWPKMTQLFDAYMNPQTSGSKWTPSVLIHTSKLLRPRWPLEEMYESILLSKNTNICWKY